MGNHSSEGVLTAEWDMRALRQLWEQSETPLRKALALGQASKMLASLYQRLQDAPRLTDGENGAAESGADALPTIALDELSVLASVTSRWPLRPTPDDDAAAAETVTDWPEAAIRDNAPAVDADAPYEEETDEMDALANAQDRENKDVTRDG